MTDKPQTSLLASLLPRLPGDVTPLRGGEQPRSDEALQSEMQRIYQEGRDAPTEDLQDPEELAEAEARQLIEGTPWQTEGDDEREDGRVVLLWVACIATAFVVLCAGLEWRRGSGRPAARAWGCDQKLTSGAT